MRYMEENWTALDTPLSDKDERSILNSVERVQIADPNLPLAFAGYNYTDIQ